MKTTPPPPAVNFFMREVPIIEKPVHWFALQIYWENGTYEKSENFIEHIYVTNKKKKKIFLLEDWIIAIYIHNCKLCVGANVSKNVIRIFSSKSLDLRGALSISSNIHLPNIGFDLFDDSGTLLSYGLPLILTLSLWSKTKFLLQGCSWGP